MTDHEKPEPLKSSSMRTRGNRLLGLSSYAGVVVLLGLFGMNLFDWASVKKDPTTLIVFGVAALVCFGIGYSSSQRK